MCVYVCARDKRSTHLRPVTTGKTEWNADCLLLLISVKGSLGVVILEACSLLVMQILDPLNQTLRSEATNLCFDVPHLGILMQGSLWEALLQGLGPGPALGGWETPACTELLSELLSWSHLQAGSGWYSPSLLVLGVNQLFSLPGFCG